jgi:hypothetical protein
LTLSVAIKLKDIFGKSECIYASAPCRQRSETNHDTADYFVNIKGWIALGKQPLIPAVHSDFLSNSNTRAEYLP